MASNILNTLQRIEEDRQIQIERAREYGWTVSDNASFNDLSTCITSNTYKAINTPLQPWTRPADWPNGKEILDNTEARGTLMPGVFVLLDTKYMSDSIVLPQLYVEDQTTYTNLLNGTFSNSTGSATTTDTFVNTNANAYLTSDGVYYGNVTSDITHTWDQTKDIVCEDGTYRWIIFFFDESFNNYGGVMLQTWPVVEIIYDFIGVLPRNIWFNYLCFRGSNIPSLALKNKWPAIETLQSVVIKSLINDKDATYKADMFHGFQQNIGSWRYWSVSVCNNLRNFELGDNYFYQYSSNANSIITTANLQEINIKSSNSATNINLPTCIKELTFNTTSQSYIYSYMNVPYLQTINAVNAVLYINYNSNNRETYFPEDASVNVRSINLSYKTPMNWTTVTKNKFGSPFTPNETGLDYYMGTSVNTIDLSDCNRSTSGNSTVYNNSFQYITVSNAATRLTNIIWPNNIVVRWYINSPIKKQIILDLIDHLKDITEDTVYYPYLLLSGANYAKLTTAEIKVAKDKGWIIYPFN